MLVLLALLLLREDPMELNVAVVHNQIICEETLQDVAVNHIKLVVGLQATHQPLHASFVIFPLFAMLLNLNLSFRQLLVKLLQVILWIKHLAVFGDLLE